MSRTKSDCPVISLDKLSAAASGQSGAKAANLGKIKSRGLPVPDGFCVTAQAYRAHLQDNGLLGPLKDKLRRLRAAQTKEKTELLAQIQDMIAAASLPSPIRQHIQKNYQSLNSEIVAVRSSASAEDLTNHSFAGQYDSFLGIANLDQCIRAIKKCWASLWTRRAYEYRSQAKIDHQALDMAVIIQQFIPADVSGVIFTADPITGRNDRIVIESTWGLGEPLVGGRIAPDRTVIAKNDFQILDRQIANKTIACLWDQSAGVTERELTPVKKTAASLNKNLARRLGRLALETEKLFGYPLDLEFAVAADEIYLLQVRPVTTLQIDKAAAEDRQVWTNANSGEVLPDVVTPMTWSVVEPLATKLVASYFKIMGFNLQGYPLFGLIAGRVYFNVNTILGCTKKIPGLRNKGVTEIFGGQQDSSAFAPEIKIDEKDIPKFEYGRWDFFSKLPKIFLTFLSYSAQKADRLYQKSKKLADELSAVDRAALNDRQLTQRICRDVRRVSDSFDEHSLVGVAVTYQTMFYDLARRWLGDPGKALVSRLFAGLGDNQNAQAGLQLWQLADKARRYPPLKKDLLAADGFKNFQSRVISTSGGADFLWAWDAFMRRHGHHARGEVELSNPRWFEIPDEILQQLKSYIHADEQDDFSRRYDLVKKQRVQALIQCRKLLKNPIKRLIFLWILKKARQGAPLRENLKNQMVRQITVLRLSLLELGCRLARPGVLLDRDDIFFFKLNELESLIQNNHPPKILDDVADRKAEYQKNLSITPPPVIMGRYDPAAVMPPFVDPDCQTLKGIAVNPGVVAGPARVILPSRDDQLRPGEILVAPFTDPGWTPYFLNAAAIVMDMGGILSHGSIVAREYGIPAVVNVATATKIIKTGQIIQVDGNRGEVKILPAPYGTK